MIVLFCFVFGNCVSAHIWWDLCSQSSNHRFLGLAEQCASEVLAFEWDEVYGREFLIEQAQAMIVRARSSVLRIEKLDAVPGEDPEAKSTDLDDRDAAANLVSHKGTNVTIVHHAYLMLPL